MNSKISIKIILDFTMIIVYLLLLDAFGTGLVFHEIAGLFAGTLFIVHIFLNWVWVKNFIKFRFWGKSTKKAVLMYFVNIGLFLGVSIIIITGILISQVIFPTGSSRNSDLLVSAHKLASYSCLGLIAMHASLHRKYILASLRSTFADSKRKLVLALGMGVIIGILFERNILGSDNRLTSTTKPLIISSQNSTNSSQNSNPTIDNPQGNDQISLSDYLGNKFCTGCNKHCSLLSPECDRGEAQSQAAKIEYQNLYGQISANSSDINGQTQKDSQNSNPTIDNPQGNDQISLSDYLGNKFCTGCNKHCSLLSPECDRGEAQSQAAKIEYQNLYGQISSDTSINKEQNNDNYYHTRKHQHKGFHGTSSQS